VASAAFRDRSRIGARRFLLAFPVSRGIGRHALFRRDRGFGCHGVVDRHELSTQEYNAGLRRGVSWSDGPFRRSPVRIPGLPNPVWDLAKTTRQGLWLDSARLRGPERAGALLAHSIAA